MSLEYLFPFEYLCVFAKRGGEEPEWRKTRTDDWEPGRCARALVPQRVPVFAFEVHLLIGPEKAWRFTMRHSGPDLHGVNRPKPMILDVCPVPGSRSFPSTMTNQAESKHEVWQGELDGGERGQMWNVARRPLKGRGRHNPPLEPSTGRVNTDQAE